MTVCHVRGGSVECVKNWSYSHFSAPKSQIFFCNRPLNIICFTDKKKDKKKKKEVKPKEKEGKTIKKTAVRNTMSLLLIPINKHFYLFPKRRKERSLSQKMVST